MRTILILILTLLLLAAAFVTRPGKREFVIHLLDSPGGNAAPWSSGAAEHADRVSKQVKFNNRWLWVDVEKEGKVIYTGLFGHWVPRGENLEQVMPDTKDLARLIAAAK